jgi:hypothetical protein
LQDYYGYYSILATPKKRQNADGSRYARSG